MSISQKVVKRSLLEFIQDLKIIDTHEHLPYSEHVREKQTDILKEYLEHYFNRDLISAGLSVDDFKKVIDISIPLIDRWNIVEPYWELSRYTGYGRALDYAVQGIYGFDRIDRNSIEGLNEKFLRSLSPGHFRKVLHQLCGIEVSLLDSLDEPLESDKSFFRNVFRIDSFVFPHSWQDIYELEKLSGIRIHSLQSYVEACDAALSFSVEKGAVALKCALAYERPLEFAYPDTSEAEKDFSDMLGQRHIPDWTEAVIVPGKAFQDYIFHALMEANSRIGLPVQIHTGLQEGNGNYIRNSDPSLLTNVFLQYPDIRFDLFHVSYPFHKIAGVLAKNFPHVFLDMCWAHIISPTACVEVLDEWLDLVPFNKIFAFGGDFKLIDGVYGHLKIAQDNVSETLARKVGREIISETTAREIARRLFHDNAREFFEL